MRASNPVSQSTSFKKLALASAFAALYSPLLFAQDSKPRLEEVIVTAQKRVESLQEVPISVATVDGDKMDDAGVETLEDITILIPNIHFTETGFSTQVRVRGIGSDNSQGFEQSVGMYIDGIYYGRAQLFRTPMMDMERVELLRGPQSTLFGKNTIAGALNITTARPTEELEGKISAEFEPEFNRQEYNALVSGPITDSLRARIAVRNYTEDGYLENTHKNTDDPSADETAVRVSIEWDVFEDLNFFLKHENNSFKTDGRPIELTHDEALDPSTQPATYAQILGSFGQPPIENVLDYKRQTDAPETSDNTITNTTFIADYSFADHTLTAVTGLLDFEYDELCDCDNTSSKILDLALGEDYSQFSQEIRIASPTDQKVDWIAGVYYQTYEQTFYDELTIAADNLLPAVLSNRDPALANLSNTGLVRNFEQNSDMWAVFARATFHATDRLHITLGARYTEETKDASKIIQALDLTEDGLMPFPQTQAGVSRSIAAGLTYLGAFDAENEQATVAPTAGGLVPIPNSGHNVQQERDESAFNPLLNIEFDINNDMMSYFSYTTGFKAGGFDPRSNSVGALSSTTTAPVAETNPYQHFEFEEETATNYEVGLKTTVFDGRGEFNIALYRTDYDDLQISQFDGKVGFNVGNAKKTQVQGIEIDGRFAFTDALIANYGVSLLDFEYKDFKNGNCHAGQTPDGLDIFGDSELDTCDYTGKRGVYTPEYTFNFGLDYTHTLSQNLSLNGFIDTQHVASHNVHVNLDPNGEIDAYNMLSARISLDAENWSVALLGKNLLDEYIISYSGDAPLAESSFGTRTFYSVARRPRTISLQGTYRF